MILMYPFEIHCAIKIPSSSLLRKERFSVDWTETFRFWCFVCIRTNEKNQKPEFMSIPHQNWVKGDNGTMGGVIYQILPRSAMITFFVQSHANIHMNRTVFTGLDIPQMIFQCNGRVTSSLQWQAYCLASSCSHQEKKIVHIKLSLILISSYQLKLEIGSQTDIVEGVDYPYF